MFATLGLKPSAQHALNKRYFEPSVLSFRSSDLEAPQHQVLLFSCVSLSCIFIDLFLAFISHGLFPWVYWPVFQPSFSPLLTHPLKPLISPGWLWTSQQCSQEWLCTSDPAVSTSQVQRPVSGASMLTWQDAGEGDQCFLHEMQALYRLNYVLSPHPSFTSPPQSPGSCPQQGLQITDIILMSEKTP